MSATFPRRRSHRYTHTTEGRNACRHLCRSRWPNCFHSLANKLIGAFADSDRLRLFRTASRRRARRYERWTTSATPVKKRSADRMIDRASREPGIEPVTPGTIDRHVTCHGKSQTSFSKRTHQVQLPAQAAPTTTTTSRLTMSFIAASSLVHST